MAKSQIIKDLANSNVNTQTALKRTKVLLQDLKNEALLEWINCEIEGYPEGAIVPEYRIISGQLYGSYFVGSPASHIIYNDVAISLGNLTDEQKDQILTVNITQGIDALRELLEESKKNSKGQLVKPISAEFYPAIAIANNNRGMMITTANVQLSMAKIFNIFPKVESKLLDILSYLEKQFGNLDNLDIDIKKKSKQELSGITNHISVIMYSDYSVTIGDNNKIKDSKIASSIKE